MLKWGMKMVVIPFDELYNEIMQQWRAKQLIEIANEVDKYITDPFEKLNSTTAEFDLLLWW